MMVGRFSVDVEMQSYQLLSDRSGFTEKRCIDERKMDSVERRTRIRTEVRFVKEANLTILA